MSKVAPNGFLFAGPSLNGIEGAKALLENSLRLLPPVQRGDIEKLVAETRPGVMILVDGVFHQRLAVGHIEIRDALASGWSVWGLSSMGAIRAYEMRYLGVRGYGRVYRCFFEYADFHDDEVALLHEPEPPYRSFSEPLVHIRFWLQEMRHQGLLTLSQETHILDALMSMWFGERTLPAVRRLVLDLIPQHHEAVDARLAQFDRYRVKSLDLADFLREQPWKLV